MRILKALARKKTGAARIAKTLKRTEGAHAAHATSQRFSLNSIYQKNFFHSTFADKDLMLKVHQEWG